MRVFIAGGTGLVGKRLVRRLLERGDQPVVLTRRADAARELWGNKVEVVAGDPMQTGDWMKAVQTSDAVINLVGEGIFNKRWSASFKQVLWDSRVISTRHVVEALKTPNCRAKVLVNASAIGYYGPHGDEELDESSPAGSDFLARLCIDWEEAALAARSAGVRVCLVRVGVVLEKGAGALQKMLLPFKLFMGGPVGSGRQFMSWIHVEDLVNLFLVAMDRNDIEGPLNGTAPKPVTNKEFSRTLGSVLHRPSFMPAPAFGLRILLGEVANVVTKGQKVIPRKPLEIGFRFEHTNLEQALRNLL